MPPHLGRYALGSLLGVGGSGRVYEAVQELPGGIRRVVALKVLAAGAAGLRREARIGGSLRHPGLVDVYEVGEDAGYWFCAMERCEGSLTGLAPLSPRAVVDVGLQVCEALQYAQEELGLVHLDLKPDNLLLLNGRVKVADLGLAHAQGFEDRGRRGGTPGYLAPEQVGMGPVDARADVHALGATLVKLATGARVAAPATFDPDSEDAAAADPVPSWLAAVAARCLAPSPEDRFPSMAALAEALRALEVTGTDLRTTLRWRPPPPASTIDDWPGEEGLVGRDADLERLDAALAVPGIVALKGPPGIGKSRLASAATSRWVRSGRPGYRCDLAEARAPADLWSAVARALGVPPDASDPVVRIGHALASRGQALLLLDDADAVEGLAPALVALRQRASAARMLVTARAAPNVAESQVIELGPLDPTASAALLVLRAGARGVELSDDDTLRHLASHLDGLPLALELAAGRLGILTVADVLARLREGDRPGLSLLRTGTADRHGTLAVALDASWALLTPAQRDGLARLTVFAGGFELDAAEAVLATSDALELLSGLVDRSLVRALPTGRFALGSIVRAYASAQLADREAVEVRHGRHYAQLGSEAVLRSPEAAIRAAIEREHDNLVVATRRAIGRGDAQVGVATAHGALVSRRPPELGVELTTGLLALELGRERGRATLLASRALWAAGRLDEASARAVEALVAAVGVGNVRLQLAAMQLRAVFDHSAGRHAAARAQLEAALDLGREVGDDAATAMLLGSLGTLAAAEGKSDLAITHHEGGLALHRRRGDIRGQGSALVNLAAILIDRGDHGRAQSCSDEAISLLTAIGDRSGVAIARSNLAVLRGSQGAVDEAAEHYRAALALQREIGDRRNAGVTLNNLAAVCPPEEALGLYTEALELHIEMGNRRFETLARLNLGNTHFDAGRPEEAERWWRGALPLSREIGARDLEGFLLGRMGQLDALAGRATEAALRMEEAEALLVPSGRRPLLARVVAMGAEVAFHRGDHAGADAALLRATELADNDRSALRDVDRIAARLHPGVGRSTAP